MSREDHCVEAGDARVDVALEAAISAPGGAPHFERPLQSRDAALDARPKLSKFPEDPLALRHVVLVQPALLVEHHILYAGRLGGLQVVP